MFWIGFGIGLLVGFAVTVVVSALMSPPVK